MQFLRISSGITLVTKYPTHTTPHIHTSIHLSVCAHALGTRASSMNHNLQGEEKRVPRDITSIKFVNKKGNCFKKTKTKKKPHQTRMHTRMHAYAHVHVHTCMHTLTYDFPIGRFSISPAMTTSVVPACCFSGPMSNLIKTCANGVGAPSRGTALNPGRIEDMGKQAHPKLWPLDDAIAEMCTNACRGWLMLSRWNLFFSVHTASALSRLNGGVLK